MHVLVAPDSFKGSVTAVEAAAAIARGWRRERPHDLVEELPQADGGEGTADAVARATPGARRVGAGAVTGPAGGPVPGEWLLLPDGTAVVEMAQTSGLPLMPRPDALGATSRGLGEVIAAALDADCERLVIALGGSASTDGGIPALEAIGGRTSPPGGAVLLTDVDNPLLGPRGAAAVFGPQKGASREDVLVLERRLARIARRIGLDPALPGAGAAGGTAYGLLSWGATIQPGAPAIARLTGLTATSPDADLIVTGEGRFDEQSLGGKVVGHVLGLGRPVAVVAGALALAPSCPAVALVDLAGSPAASLAAPSRWLEAAGALLASGV